jgi:hypothetical protein
VIESPIATIRTGFVWTGTSGKRTRTAAQAAELIGDFSIDACHYPSGLDPIRIHVTPEEPATLTSRSSRG